ncbi:MAG: HNH endonuclease [Desulfobulbaceae bacterium]|nr:HNH endonuclease [Candidatus Kapabacteria bacterium]MBS3999326.1 HNH endonuclease [Desulfobulbaceae bacterium]
MNNIAEILIEIQDYLVPQLDTYEQAIYHYILRHTILVGKREMYFSTRSAEIGYGQGTKNTNPSGKQRSAKLRSLESKGAIRIVERSNKGIKVKIFLPSEMSGLIKEEISSDINIETLDFYTNKKLIGSILERENNKCFYTGRSINESNCYLDHVIPQSKGGNNTYRNIVATCYDANSAKREKDAIEFLREMYRDEIISLSEFNEVKMKLGKLTNGELVPNIETIMQAINS